MAKKADQPSLQQITQRRYAAYEMQVDRLKALLNESREMMGTCLGYHAPGRTMGERRDILEELTELMAKIEHTIGAPPPKEPEVKEKPKRFRQLKQH